MTQSELPLVSVIVPARDEEQHLANSLRAILDQSYPAKALEVIVVNGRSSDRTAEVARGVLASSSVSFWSVLDGPGETPANLNTGLNHATGSIVCRVDARSLLPRDYVSTCVEVLTADTSVAVVGGAQVAVAPREGPVGTGIARALNNRFAMGLARYRRRGRSGPTDTVYLGSFRTDDLRAAGGWDERLATNQDFDLNQRLGRSGVVWFVDELDVGYVPRSALVELFRQYHRFGRWKVRFWRMTASRPTPRQWLLLAGAPATAVVGLAVLSKRPVAGLGVLVVASFGVEALGTTGPEAGLRGRLAAVAAMAIVSTGWLTGIGREVVGGS